MKVQTLVLFFVLLGAAIILGCRSPQQRHLFESLPAKQTGIGFENNLNPADSLSVLDFEYRFNGAGVALLDINRDGLTDVLFTGNQVSTRLYLNKGNLKFEDITQKAGLQTEGWCYGASVVDINQDGYPDVYICKAGNRRTGPEAMRNLFFINNGNGTFTESAQKMGLDDDGYDIQAAFLDYDADGDLDLYLLRNAFVSYNRNTARLKQVDGGAPSTDRLYRNNGNGSFTNVSRQAGISIEGFGLGVAVCDFNNDNRPDIYVSNDFLTNNLLWMNNGDGTFTNKADSMLRHSTYNAMGNDVADFNNDGLEDIVEVDMLPPDNKRRKLTLMGNTYEQFQQDLAFGYGPQYVRNTLQLNNGDGSFSEIGQLAGIEATEWSWAPLLADFDNDGHKDLFVTNGYRQDVTNLDFILYGKKALFMGTPQASRNSRIAMLQQYEGIKVPNYLFKNNGNLTFTNVANEWGLDDATYANGAAYGDLDNDGDLDLVVNNLDGPASVFESRVAQINKGNTWLRIGFKGPPGNRDGLGAKVTLWQGGSVQYQYFSTCRGYLSSMEPYLHFGLGNKKPDSLKVVWPDGRQQLWTAPAPNQMLVLDYRDAQSPRMAPRSYVAPLFSPGNKETGITYRHAEDEFVDFKLQPLLPRLLSHEGPALSVADVNGDGLDDFFAGAAAGGRGQLFTQQKNGRFLQQQLPDSNRADNMGALFFDADGDGDQDLYLASGGVSAHKAGDAIYAHRFYSNDGNGGFTLLPAAMPPISSSAASVVAADFDRDGDLDLFVGGRVSPGSYPMPPQSYLLRNDSKKGSLRFTDVTAALAPGLAQVGMVASALWTDCDNDGWPDLLLAGEFMPITFIKNNGGKRFAAPHFVAQSSGWWNSLAAADFDADGDVDYVAGNRGLNGPYRASAKEPVCVYAADYDRNGRLDPVLCHFEGGKEYIVHTRDDMGKQITPMRARFRDYSSYARAGFREAFRADEISRAYVLRCETFGSAYIENLGAGKFRLHQLPLEAQLAPIYGMLCRDFNNDGAVDVLCVGNSYATEVQTGRYDAQGSFLLLGNGAGAFAADRKRLNLGSDNKAVAALQTASGASLFLISSNSDSLRAFYFNGPAQKTVPVAPNDAYALIRYRNGKSRKEEFYWGSSYLSQTGRRLQVPAAAQSIEIFNANGKKRVINF